MQLSSTALLFPYRLHLPVPPEPVDDPPKPPGRPPKPIDDPPKPPRPPEPIDDPPPLPEIPPKPNWVSMNIVPNRVAMNID